MSREKLLINNPKSNNSEDMSNKQIEEMAKCCIYHKDGFCVIDSEISYCDLMCKMFGFITNLYNAGYRKQSEGEWETEELTKADSYLFFSHICSNCNYFYKDARPFGYDYCPNCGAKMKGGAEE